MKPKYYHVSPIITEILLCDIIFLPGHYIFSVSSNVISSIASLINQNDVHVEDTQMDFD